MKIALFQLGYETNTFRPGRAEIPDLGTGDWIKGEDVIDTFKGTHTGLGGILDALDEWGAQPVPLDLISRGGAFNAGCPMSRECVEDSIAHICGELARQEFDGVCAVMHGAGFGDGYTDADGYFLKQLRRVAGDRPVFAVLDLHANVSEEMVRYADGLFSIKTLPHTDFYEAGYRETMCMCRMLAGEIRPRMAFCPIPMLVPDAHGATTGGVGKELREYIDALCAEKGLLDLSYVFSFSGTDSPHTSACILAIADGYVPDAEAKEAAMYVWSRRGEYLRESLDAAQAVDEALRQVKEGYVVINDGDDNPGGGNPGDGTYLLKEFIDRDLPGFIMGPLFDPAAAALCHTHRIGDVFDVEVGGHSDLIYGPPLKVKAQLVNLCDGVYICASPVYKGARMDHGPSARLRVGNVEFVVVSRRFQTYDDRPFLMTGADLRKYRVVGLKSQNHFRAYFRERADAIVSAVTPSSLPSDIRKIPYQHVPRPIFPLDEDARFDGSWHRK